jgi:uncharacterized protein DUF3540
MHNLARTIDTSEVRYEHGTVTSTKGGVVIVRAPSGVLTARRAVSCMVAPDVGDVVVVAMLPTGAVYVHAVLERSGDSATRLEIQGDLQIDLPTGAFRVAAARGVSLVTEADVAVAAGGLHVRAVDGSAALDRFTTVVGYLRTKAEKVLSMAGTVDLVAERVVETMKRCYRFVDEVDRKQAGTIDHRATGNLSMQAKNALVTAETLVKMDGAQIHLG